MTWTQKSHSITPTPSYAAHRTAVFSERGVYKYHAARIIKLKFKGWIVDKSGKETTYKNLEIYEQEVEMRPER